MCGLQQGRGCIAALKRKMASCDLFGFPFGADTVACRLSRTADGRQSRAPGLRTACTHKKLSYAQLWSRLVVVLTSVTTVTSDCATGRLPTRLAAARARRCGGADRTPDHDQTDARAKRRDSVMLMVRASTRACDVISDFQKLSDI